MTFKAYLYKADIFWYNMMCNMMCKTFSLAIIMEPFLQIIVQVDLDLSLYFPFVRQQLVAFALGVDKTKTMGPFFLLTHK